MMGIPPTEFWNMGMPELMKAIYGFSEFNGNNDRSGSPLMRDELQDLMERFPD